MISFNFFALVFITLVFGQFKYNKRSYKKRILIAFLLAKIDPPNTDLYNVIKP